MHIATAGWTVSKRVIDRFPAHGSHLVRYAHVLPGVEINSSFYRSHAPATFARWAASVPEHFRFAVKVPRTVTHERGLRSCASLLERFLAETAALGTKRGPLLVQLLATFAFDILTVDRFFGVLRMRYDGEVVCEPRHPSWFDTPVSDLLEAHRVGGVAADPPRAPREHPNCRTVRRAHDLLMATS